MVSVLDSFAVARKQAVAGVMAIALYLQIYVNEMSNILRSVFI